MSDWLRVALKVVGDAWSLLKEVAGGSSGEPLSVTDSGLI